MAEVRYRTYVRTLVERIMEQSGTEDFTTIDKRRLTELIGVSPPTFYEWWNADSDDVENYLPGYNTATEWKFQLFFAERLNEIPGTLKVVERVVLDPECQEIVAISVCVA